MIKYAEDLLNDLYQLYRETGNRERMIRYDGLDSFDPDLANDVKRKTINAVEELAERGLVEIEGRAIGFIQIKLTPRGIDHFEAPPSPPVSQNINIGTIAGSAIVGSQTHATLNVGATLTDVSALISELPGIQKAIGENLLQELKGMESGEKEIKKGALSKFSDLLAKHSDLSTAVLEFIGKLLVGA